MKTRNLTRRIFIKSSFATAGLAGFPVCAPRFVLGQNNQVPPSNKLTMGCIGNWGIHHLDIAQWGNGTEMTGPVSIEGRGVFPKEGLADCALSWQVENRFANGATLV